MSQNYYTNVAIKTRIIEVEKLKATWETELHFRDEQRTRAQKELATIKCELEQLNESLL